MFTYIELLQTCEFLILLIGLMITIAKNFKK